MNDDHGETIGADRVRKKDGRLFGTLAAVAGLTLAGILVWRAFAAGGVPPMFDAGLSFETASARAAAEGKLVFAFATADWCGPCQSFKRGALRNGQVEAWVAENAVPVYIDTDAEPELAQRLRVRGIPAVRLLRDGEVVGAAEGVMGADEFLAWAREAARN